MTFFKTGETYAFTIPYFVRNEILIICVIYLYLAQFAKKLTPYSMT